MRRESRILEFCPMVSLSTALDFTSWNPTPKVLPNRGRLFKQISVYNIPYTLFINISKRQNVKHHYKKLNCFNIYLTQCLLAFWRSQYYVNRSGNSSWICFLPQPKSSFYYGHYLYIYSALCFFYLEYKICNWGSTVMPVNRNVWLTEC